MMNILRLTANDEDIDVVTKYFDVESDSLRAELRLLKHRLAEHIKLGDCNEWLDWLQQNGLGALVYKDFFEILKGFAVVSVTSGSCEQTFSKHAIVQTKLR